VLVAPCAHTGGLPCRAESRLRRKRVQSLDGLGR
jgi:hypothetical protein